MATALGYPNLLIGSYPLANHGVRPRNLLDLLNARYLGDDRPLANEGDVLPFGKYYTQSFHLIEVVILGRCDTDGNVAADPQGQAWLTFLELRDAVAPLPTSTNRGLRTCTLQVPPAGALELEADCHVGPLQYQRADGPNITATLEIDIPDGLFGEPGS